MATGPKIVKTNNFEYKVTDSKNKADKKKSKKKDLKARFDPGNIDKTLHPVIKDYGHMPITEAKTPWPRNEGPVDAGDLRTRLQKLSGRSSIHSFQSVHSVDFNEEDIARVSPTVRDPLSRAAFIKKRKRFDANEFKIAKGVHMSEKFHEPIPDPFMVGAQVRLSVIPGNQYSYLGNDGKLHTVFTKKPSAPRL